MHVCECFLKVETRITPLLIPKWKPLSFQEIINIHILTYYIFGWVDIQRLGAISGPLIQSITEPALRCVRPRATIRWLLIYQKQVERKTW